MTTINNEVQKPDDATLIVKRMLNATPERAFQAWTSAEHIQQWMRPEPGMVVPLASMDLRVGGKFRIQMKMPDGEFFTAVGVFKEVKAAGAVGLHLGLGEGWKRGGVWRGGGQAVADHGGVSEAGRADRAGADAQPVRHGGEPG